MQELVYLAITHIVLCRALVYISHGVGEYMGRYDELGAYLSQNGLLVFGHDHGKSTFQYMY